jgi:threonine aldolase
MVAPGVTNVLFVKMPVPLMQGLLQQGFGFYYDRWGPGVARLVTSFQTTPEQVDRIVSAARQLQQA